MESWGMVDCVRLVVQELEQVQVSMDFQFLAYLWGRLN